MTNQLGKKEYYEYDLNQNLIKVKDRKGQLTTYTYDFLSRLVNGQYADGSKISYSYDAGGRLTTVNDTASGMISFSYDNLDRMIKEITALGAISYEYDALGRRMKMQVARQEPVTYQYDSNSRLTNLQSGILNFALSYDALGRRISTSLPNGITTTYSYDNASNLLELSHLSATQLIEKLTYVYDPNGNRTSMNRLNVPVKLPNAVSNTSYNSANEMLTFSDKNITYDNNGNMTSVTNACGITNYTWNARNQLSAINGFNTDCSPLTASFKYDALGRRIEKTINGDTMQYLYDGLDIVQEIKDGTVYTNYIRTLNIDEPLARIKSDGTIRYYQQDALGSVIALTDENGTIKTQYKYDSFGNTELIGEASDNPFQYTGRENDGTGLYYYRARYYSPELQRFISQDPIGLNGGMNLYSYTFNNPVNFVDPFGLIIDWGNYVIHNSQVQENLTNLNQQIVNSGIPDAQFTLRVTGGDRYRDDNGAIRSATDNSIIANSDRNSPHLLNNGARALDLQLIGVSNDVFDRALSNTAFLPSATRRNYTDGHTHINLPNQRQYYWDTPKKGCDK